MPLAFTLAAPMAAAVLAALVETIPIRLDDTSRCRRRHGSVLWIGSLMTVPRCRRARTA